MNDDDDVEMWSVSRNSSKLLLRQSHKLNQTTPTIQETVENGGPGATAGGPTTTSSIS